MEHLEQTWQKLLSMALISLTLLSLASPAQAAAQAAAPAKPHWQLMGQSADGLAQQYADLNSIRAGDGDRQWIVDSYFTERQASEQVQADQVQADQVRADYVTLYDCDRQRYKDINSDGIPAMDWGSAQADPLNQATLEFICDRMAPHQAS